MVVGTWVGWLVTLGVVLGVAFGTLGLLYTFRPWPKGERSE